MDAQKCPGCGVELPAQDGPVHQYLEASAACWARYGELLAREYQDPEYRRVHRLTVDAYSAQHPGSPSRQNIQSVAGHLIALHAVLERGLAHAHATALIGRAIEAGGFVWLEPPAGPARLNVLHPLAAGSPAAHERAVNEWARDVWRSWAKHHDRVRAWAERSWAPPSGNPGRLTRARRRQA